MKRKKKKLAPVISLSKRKRRKRPKKEVRPEDHQPVPARPLAGDAKGRYAHWKEEQEKKD